MNRFALLLDRLSYEPARNGKLRLITDYFRTAGRALTGMSAACAHAIATANAAPTPQAVRDTFTTDLPALRARAPNAAAGAKAHAAFDARPRES